jgi:phage terminase small subunit
MADLTPKQALFVAHYVACWNATEAARRAGYAAGGIGQAAHKLLKNAEIQAAIAVALDEVMPASEVLTRLAQHARSDIRDFLAFDADGKVLGLQLDRAAPLHLVKSITPTKYGDKVELHDPQAALTQLGKYHKLWTDRIELGGDIDWTRVPDEVLDAYRAGKLSLDDVRRSLTS